MFALTCLKRCVEKFGFGKVNAQCDPENAAKDAVIKVARGIGNSATPRFAPKTSKGSNGMAGMLHSFIESSRVRRGLGGGPSGRSAASWLS